MVGLTSKGAFDTFLWDNYLLYCEGMKVKEKTSKNKNTCIFFNKHKDIKVKKAHSKIISTNCVRDARREEGGN